MRNLTLRQSGSRCVAHRDIGLEPTGFMAGSNVESIMRR